MLLSPKTGLYEADWCLNSALLEELTYIDNMSVTYHQVIAPLTAIAQEAERGGAKRLIAREKFRQVKEDSDFWVHGDFEDFSDDDCDFEMLAGEDLYWVIFFEGPGINWEPGIVDGDDVVQALLADPENKIVIAYECTIGFVYVLRSPETAMGTCPEGWRMSYPEMHPFTDLLMVLPDSEDDTAYAVPAHILKIAAECYEAEESAERERALG